MIAPSAFSATLLLPSVISVGASLTLVDGDHEGFVVGQPARLSVTGDGHVDRRLGLKIERSARP